MSFKLDWPCGEYLSANLPSCVVAANCSNFSGWVSLVGLVTPPDPAAPAEVTPLPPVPTELAFPAPGGLIVLVEGMVLALLLSCLLRGICPCVSRALVLCPIALDEESVVKLSPPRWGLAGIPENKVKNQQQRWVIMGN